MYNLLIPLGLVLLFIMSAIKIMKEYERAVIFTLGRFTKVAGPGLIIVIPFVQTITRVDTRVVVMDIPPQDVISKDNISVGDIVNVKIVDTTPFYLKAELL